MLNTKFGSNWTNRLEVIQFLINFSFRRRPSWLLKNGGFDTSDVWAVSRRSSVPNFARIGRTVRELFKFL